MNSQYQIELKDNYGSWKPVGDRFNSLEEIQKDKYFLQCKDRGKSYRIIRIEVVITG